MTTVSGDTSKRRKKTNIMKVRARGMISLLFSGQACIRSHWSISCPCSVLSSRPQAPCSTARTLR
uniref:Uncharacterized protein n=1 Tax=Anguilla anguilla TaxID=7936 RepID=A0A0E9QUC0_ANGAN